MDRVGEGAGRDRRGKEERPGAPAETPGATREVRMEPTPSAVQLWLLKERQGPFPCHELRAWRRRGCRRRLWMDRVRCHRLLWLRWLWFIRGGRCRDVRNVRHWNRRASRIVDIWAGRWWNR